MHRHSLCRNVGSYPNKWKDLFRQGHLFRVVDLGALELVGVVDVEGFPFGVEIDGGDCGFAVAVAGFLSAAEGQVSFGADGSRAHIDHPAAETAHGPNPATPV